MKAQLERFGALPAVLLGALILRLLAGVGFANYDTLYALVWGQQLSRGETPQYGIPVAPTPHPLVEALGFVLSPFGPRAAQSITVALGFIALSGCGWVVYRLGARWFGRAAGALAAVLLLTRLPILSYGVRAYVDIPYLLLVLSAVLVATRDSAAQKPALVLLLLAFAGLLRPEAWAFSGLYWLYLALRGPFSRSQLARLALLACAAPLIWVLSDWLVTGEPFWSLTNTRNTASELGRARGVADIPEYIPRRLGEILRPPVLLGAALGGVLALLWIPSRARVGATMGVVAVGVFALLAGAGLPIVTRYAFLAAALLCIFCGAGVFGWTQLPSGDPHRRPWMVGGAVVALALLVFAPSQYRSVHNELDALSRQQSIQRDLVALVRGGMISPRCGPVGVPNHRPIPLLALELKASPADVVSAQVRTLTRGTYVQPATRAVELDYILDPHDPGSLTPMVPPGFGRVGSNRSWTVYRRCS